MVIYNNGDSPIINTAIAVSLSVYVYLDTSFLPILLKTTVCSTCSTTKNDFKRC